jgi:hypothetical protein
MVSGYIYLVEYVVKPLMNGESDEAVIDKEAPNWHRLAGILDALLVKSKWLVGGNVTIADIAVAAPMHVHKWQRLPLNDHPNLKRWMADVEQLPCWEKTQGAVERALVRALINDMREEWCALDHRICAFDNEFAARAREDERARRLTTIPGIGVLSAPRWWLPSVTGRVLRAVAISRLGLASFHGRRLREASRALKESASVAMCIYASF